VYVQLFQRQSNFCQLRSYIYPKCRGIKEDCENTEKNIRFSYDGGVIEGDNSWYGLALLALPLPCLLALFHDMFACTCVSCTRRWMSNAYLSAAAHHVARKE
jgi:hypothetical protein